MLRSVRCGRDREDLGFFAKVSLDRDPVACHGYAPPVAVVIADSEIGNRGFPLVIFWIAGARADRAVSQENSSDRRIRTPVAPTR